MENLLKNVSFLLISLLVINTSCLTSDDDLDEDTRTEEKELQELDRTIKALIQNGHNVDTTALGVYYIIHTEGEGPLVQPGDTIDIGYEGYLAEGVFFDGNESWEFIYKDQNLIPGFDDGLALMNKGCEIELIIPSRLAYGAYGSPPDIPKFATLIFGVKMNDIKPYKE